MEISYDIIIKYLSKNNNEKVNFIDKKHILSYSDKFPEKFNELLQNKFYKYGVTTHHNNINISFYTSLLTIIHEPFLTLTLDEEIAYLNMIKSNIISNTFLNSVESIIPSTKKDIIYDTKYNIQLISDYFDINILILDFKNNNIKIVYNDEICNPWKPIILLATYDNNWEPIMFDSKKIFSYNDVNIKKILKDGNVEYYNTDVFNKKYILNENIKEIIDDIQTHIYTSSDTFIKKKPIDDNDEFAKLNKKNKSELIDICKSKNIKVTTKLIKKELIELILNN
jgi:hypothetical protein